MEEQKDLKGRAREVIAADLAALANAPVLFQMLQQRIEAAGFMLQGADNIDGLGLTAYFATVRDQEVPVVSLQLHLDYQAYSESAGVGVLVWLAPAACRTRESAGCGDHIEVDWRGGTMRSVWSVRTAEQNDRPPHPETAELFAEAGGPAVKSTMGRVTSEWPLGMTEWELSEEEAISFLDRLLARYVAKQGGRQD